MFETLKEHFFESLGVTLVIIFCVIFLVFGLAMLFKPTAVQSVEIHNMTNGVTCYTFNTSIDCVKAGK